MLPLKCQCQNLYHHTCPLHQRFPPTAAQTAPADDGALSEEDEAVASDLDIHSLILAGVQAEPPDRLKTADEVIKEIDDIMDVSVGLLRRLGWEVGCWVCWMGVRHSATSG